MFIFKYEDLGQYYGPRYLHVRNLQSSSIQEAKVVGLNIGSRYISVKSLYKIAVLYNFVDKLEELCLTNRNQ
jgi:hypothetical protein